MSKWAYLGTKVEEIPEDIFGFTYIIKHKYSEIYYYGSKQAKFFRTKKLSKKAALELWKGRGKKPTKIKTSIDSDWKTYNSSSKELQEMIKKEGEDAFHFIILGFWDNKQRLSLEETKLIICNGALEDPLSLNSWVSCKIRSKNLS